MNLFVYVVTVVVLWSWRGAEAHIHSQKIHHFERGKSCRCMGIIFLNHH